MKFLISLLFAVSFGQDERIDERGPRFCGTPENKVEEMSEKFIKKKSTYVLFCLYCYVNTVLIVICVFVTILQ